MLRNDFPRIYNPANQTEDELIANFVVRTVVFESIYDDIRKSGMEFPEMHYIIQGIRGQGKTTLLLRIAYEIRKNEELMRKVIPVVFNEEQYNITRLYKLWETTARHLEESGEVQGIAKEMERIDFDDDYEEQCFDLLEGSLKKTNKKAILFIDNIDELFDKLSDTEHKRLREVLTQTAEIRLVGASSILLEFHYDYGKPFFQFFKIIMLNGLNSNETKTLLLKLGERYKTERVKEIVEKEAGRVEALRRITGGVIRTIILLFGIFVDDVSGDAFKDLERILDHVTPLYKHRMDKLSAQQQEIVDFIALQWDAVAVKEISQNIRMESKAVSSQLNQLEKYYVVEKERTNTKNHLYRIHERFFNIWYLMRCGRKWDEKRVRFLVEFLASWCDEKEIAKIAQRHLRAIDKGNVYAKQAFYVTETLARMSIGRELQDALINKTKSYLESCRSNLKEHLSHSDKELANEAAISVKAKEWENAIEKFKLIKNKTSDELLLQGICNINAGNNIDAEKSLRKAVEKGNADAMMGLALLYQETLKEYSAAERFYLLAIKNGNVEAIHNLALLYQTEFKNLTKAKHYYLLAIEKGNSKSMFNLALLYEIVFKNINKAEQYYLMAAEKNLASAMCNLAYLYENDFKDFSRAEHFYLMAIKSDDPESRICAMNSLAWNYFKKKIKRDEALRFAEQSYLTEQMILKEKYFTYSKWIFLIILLWNNEIMKVVEVTDEFLIDAKDYEKMHEDVALFLQLLIAKKQYHLTLKLFEENPNHLKDRFKPIYYALMYFLKDEYPNEYLRMGSELKETTEELIKNIREMEKDYA